MKPFLLPKSLRRKQPALFEASFNVWPSTHPSLSNLHLPRPGVSWTHLHHCGERVAVPHSLIGKQFLCVWNCLMWWNPLPNETPSSKRPVYIRYTYTLYIHIWTVYDSLLVLDINTKPKLSVFMPFLWVRTNSPKQDQSFFGEKGSILGLPSLLAIQNHIPAPSGFMPVVCEIASRKHRLLEGTSTGLWILSEGVKPQSMESSEIRRHKTQRLKDQVHKLENLELF